MPARSSSLGVIALAFGAFIFNTTEFIPIALLSDIGASFELSPTHTGIMLTVYAWIVATLSLPLMLLTRNFERKRLLLELFVVFVAGHLLSFLSQSFEILLLSRLAIALSHAIFWSITAALAVRIAPKGMENRALGLLSLGTVLAMVLGIPLGRVVGDTYGWRLSFLFIGIFALVVMSILAKSLPRLESVNSGSLSTLPSLLRRKSLLLLYALTVAIITAHFIAYSYIEPMMVQLGGFSPFYVTLVLSLYGAAGFLSAYLFGRYFARFAREFFYLCVGLIICSMALLKFLLFSPVAVAILALFWGVGITALSLAMLAKVLDFASDCTDVGSSIYSSLYNVGIGTGAFLGHYISLFFGLSNIGLIGAILALFALVLTHLLVRSAGFVKAV